MYKSLKDKEYILLLVPYIAAQWLEEHTIQCTLSSNADYVDDCKYVSPYVKTSMRTAIVEHSSQLKILAHAEIFLFEITLNILDYELVLHCIIMKSR